MSRSGGADPLEAAEHVEPVVEAQHAPDRTALHHSDVERVARGQRRMGREHVLGAVDIAELNRKDLVDDGAQRVECGLDGIATLDRNVAVQIS